MDLMILNKPIELLGDRAVWLASPRVFIVADLHFGKVDHFRRAGLPVPLAANRKNAEQLIDCINKLRPLRIIFLGDLFHSAYNNDWEVVGQIVKNYPGCDFELIRGNHDILSEQQYRRHGIEVKESEQVGIFLLTHEPMELSQIPKGSINLAGHIHPGARLVGKGRQSLTFPCFWRSENRIVLPAFGSFTGLAVIRPAAKDLVFIIVEGKVIEMKASW